MKALYLFFTMAAVKIDPGSVGVTRTDPNTTLISFLNTMYWAAGIVAVIIIIVAGLFYTLSGGNESQTKKAREAIIYAGVGLVVIMMAFAITGFIAGRF